MGKDSSYPRVSSIHLISHTSPIVVATIKMIVNYKATALLFVVFAIAAFCPYRATAFKTIHCVMKDHILEHCSEFLKNPVYNYAPIPPTKNSECCKMARLVPQWDELINCLEKEQKDNTILTGRIRMLHQICKLPALQNI